MKQVLLFTTPPCQPCKLMKPILEEIARKRTDIQYKEVNCWEEKDLVLQHKVRMSPTLIVIQDGVTICDVKGLLYEDDILAVIDSEVE